MTNCFLHPPPPCMVHFLIADLSLCGGSEGETGGGSEGGRRQGDAEGEGSGGGSKNKQHQANTFRLRALVFSLRGFFPFFTLERRWAGGQLRSDQRMHKP